MRALVTGATGLLGSWLVRALLERGATVVVLERDEVRGSLLVLEGLRERCSVVRGDITDAALMDRAIGEHEVDTVFHLAAQTIVGTAQRSPVSTFEANIKGTWTVLEACRTHRVQRVLVAASDKAYGPSDELPYVETTPLRAQNPYDVSKACTDLIARGYAHSYAMAVATTRFANLYGGGDLNPSRLIPETVAAVLDGRAPIIRSDGSPQRDYLYVEDAVEAYLAIADAPRDAIAGEAFNAGSGVPRSVLEVVEAICAASGVEVSPDVRGVGVPEGEIDRQFVDASKLRALTGWSERVGFEEGVRRTLDWTRAQRS